eukprot:tig00000806_g4334.t1
MPYLLYPTNRGTDASFRDQETRPHVQSNVNMSNPCDIPSVYSPAKEYGPCKEELIDTPADLEKTLAEYADRILDGDTSICNYFKFEEMPDDDAAYFVKSYKQLCNVYKSRGGIFKQEEADAQQVNEALAGIDGEEFVAVAAADAVEVDTAADAELFEVEADETLAYL